VRTFIRSYLAKNMLKLGVVKDKSWRRIKQRKLPTRSIG
jgi:hypothetical protein